MTKLIADLVEAQATRMNCPGHNSILQFCWANNASILKKRPSKNA